MLEFHRYWLFAGFCMVVALWMFRLVIKERVTLQASLAFLGVLLATALLSVFPEPLTWMSYRLGFTVPSNFFLAAAVGALAFLHLTSLIHLSRVQLRSVALTQELALVREQLERLTARVDAQRPPVAEPSSLALRRRERGAPTVETATRSEPAERVRTTRDRSSHGG